MAKKTYTTISLWQPWASLIADEIKHYETRGWYTPYRGLLMIHAAKKWTKSELNILNCLVFDFPEKLAKYTYTKPPLGAIVAAVNLVDCVPVEKIRDNLSDLELRVGGYSDGRFAWKLELLKVPEYPIPASGKQGFWQWTPPPGYNN